MPEIGGLDLAARLRQDAPDVPIVFISGYADDGTVPVRRPDEACVEKPFTSEGLIGALHRVLGASTRAPRGSGPASPEL
jgi:CheY-like chemotaxis protein